MNTQSATTKRISQGVSIPLMVCAPQQAAPVAAIAIRTTLQDNSSMIMITNIIISSFIVIIMTISVMHTERITTTREHKES
jgi:hypothetical protein